MLKQDKMTTDERWIALLNRQPVDRVPIYAIAAGYAGMNAGITVPDLYADMYQVPMGHKFQDMLGWMREQYGFQDFAAMGYANTGTMEFGGEMKLPSGEFSQALTIARLPVTTEEEAWSWKSPPDVKTAGVVPMMMEVSKMEAERGAPFLMILLVGAWDVACSICGIERLCKWTVRKPDVAHHVLRLATDFNTQLLQYWVDTFGPERLVIFSTHAHTAGQIVGPKTFEEFCFPYIKENHDKMLAMGVKHTITHICGYHALNYPMWAQIPMGDPGIVSVAHDTDEDWPTPLESVGKLFPNDIIMGNIEPAVFQIGTPGEVYELARQCIEVGKKHEAGYILAPGCELAPNAPPYNVWQMTKAVNDFGWYS
jgi:uroporphyrinogen decarboxylase